METPSGEKVSAVFVPENTGIIISILAANHNKEIWGPDASVYRPERWLNPNGELKSKKDVSSSSPVDAESPTGMTDKRDHLRYPGVYGSM